MTVTNKCRTLFNARSYMYGCPERPDATVTSLPIFCGVGTTAGKSVMIIYPGINCIINLIHYTEAQIFLKVRTTEKVEAC